MNEQKRAALSPARLHSITLPQIRAFERTVRLGGAHAAARHLGVTQPAVSQRIRELERTLGVSLFDRQGRSMRINPDGAMLLSYADQILHTADEMAARIGSGDPLRGVLRLGVSKSFALVGLPMLLERLMRRQGSLKTAVHVGDSKTISERLNELKLDLAITSEYGMADYIRRERLGANRHGWFAAVGPAEDAAIDSIDALARRHLVLTPPPSRHHTSVMEWFHRAGALPVQVSTCDDLSVTIRMILSGIAIGFVPARVLRDELAEGRVREIVVEPRLPAYEVWICYLVEKLGPGLRDVVDLTHRVVAETGMYD